MTMSSDSLMLSFEASSEGFDVLARVVVASKRS